MKYRGCILTVFAIFKKSVTLPSVLVEFFYMGLKSSSILTSVKSALHMFVS